MRIARLVIVGLVVLAGLGWFAPASADLSECDAGQVCLWGNNDYNWLIGERPTGGGIVNLGSLVNDEMDSWANRNFYPAAGYADANGSGGCQTFWGETRDPNVSFVNSDEVTSWKTNSGC